MRNLDLTETLAQADALVARYPGRAAGHFNRASTLMQLGCLDEAEAVFRKLSTTQPAKAHGWIGLMRVARWRGRWKEALASAEEFIRRFPDRPEGVQGKAEALMQLQQWDEALPLYLQMLDTDRRGFAFAQAIKACQKLGRRELAASMVSQRLGLDAGHGAQGKKSAGRRVSILGHSHAGPLRRGLRGWRGDAAFTVRTLPRQYPLEGGRSLDSTYAKLLTECKESTLVALSIAGNEHTQFGLVRHPVHYRFAAEQAPAQEPGVAYVPYGLIEGAVRRYMTLTENFVRFFAAAMSEPLAVLESPPPPASNQYVVEAMDPAFKEGVARFGVNDARARLELWKIRSRQLQTLASELGMAYVATPEAAVDGDGFLAPEACGNATHANESHARLVLDQLAAMVSR